MAIKSFWISSIVASGQTIDMAANLIRQGPQLAEFNPAT
jgi:hypothetical protein